MNSGCSVIVMAKAPVPGYAKTRLIPALGADGAAALAEWLLTRAVEHALDAGLGPVQLCCAPDASHRAFQRFAGWPGMSLTVQCEGDLGVRMCGAFAEALEGTPRRAARALLIGTDAPDLDATLLREAAATLARHDAVFVPAHDGGYALVGLRRPSETLFADMQWSTAQVMAQTRSRLAVAGLRFAELAPVHDVDLPADLDRLPGRWSR